MKQQDMYRVVILRGGTSKGIYILKNVLPSDPVLRDKVILAIFGSPDIREIDGLGGADVLTSKLAIIGPPTRPDADVDYTFGQVTLDEPYIDYQGNCGNISSGVGSAAIHFGLVSKVEPVTTVRIHLTNFNCILKAEVPVKDDEIVIHGDYAIAGVPGTGAKIDMDFSGTAGAKTGKILPTGNVKDKVNIEGVGEVTLTLVDAGNPTAFIAAKELGLTGTETPLELTSNKNLLDKFEKIRDNAAVMFGFAKSLLDARKKDSFIPFLCIVGPAQTYSAFTTKESIPEDSMDIVCRQYFEHTIHKALAGTVAVCAGTAARIPGTVVHDFMPESTKSSSVVRLGDPVGVFPVTIDLAMENNKPILKKAVFGRTARIIMDGYAFVKT